MKIIMTLVTSLLVSGIANAGTLKCTSIGENLAENRLVFDVTLKMNWLGTKTSGGQFFYRGSAPEETGSGEFSCEAPDKGFARCQLLNPDSNIQRIGVDPMLGLVIQISGQEHVVLFNCHK